MVEIVRKLATIRTVSKIDPIPGADNIVCLSIDGWKLVSQKGNFKEGDPCLYLEVDSFVPCLPQFEFLRDRCYKNTSNLGEGYRIRTLKLKGQVSQGLALPLTDFGIDINEYPVGSDLTELLGIQKYEKPIPLALAGRVKGNFPIFIPKTDQERGENCFNGIKFWVNYENVGEYLEALPDHLKEDEKGLIVDNGVKYYRKENGWVKSYPIPLDPKIVETRKLFEATIKLHGSSMTVYNNNDTTGVCSRNFDLEKDEANAFWKCAIEHEIVEYVKSTGKNVALQGELYGEGIQTNHDKLKGIHFYLFDIYDLDSKRYMTPEERTNFLKEHPGYKFKHVPILGFTDLNQYKEVSELIDFVEQQRSINTDYVEGVVFKSIVPGGPSFKLISRKFLLKEKD